MKGLFSCTTARNNEEYRKVVRRRMCAMSIIAVIGIAAAVIATAAFHCGVSSISDHILGIYSGAGSGMACAGLFFLIRDFLLLRNEEKLKNDRLKNTDERLVQIRDRALKPAISALLIVLYGICLIGSIFYPALIYVLLFSVWVFLITYVIACRFYQKRM